MWIYQEPSGKSVVSSFGGEGRGENSLEQVKIIFPWNQSIRKCKETAGPGLGPLPGWHQHREASRVCRWNESGSWQSIFTPFCTPNPNSGLSLLPVLNGQLLNFNLKVSIKQTIKTLDEEYPLIIVWCICMSTAQVGASSQWCLLNFRTQTIILKEKNKLGKLNGSTVN